MKYLIVLLVILVVVWLARSGSKRVTRARPKPPLPPREDMVACSQCGLHLPRSEALPGRGGVFCSEAHRADFERAHR